MEFLGSLPLRPSDRTVFEDLLTAATFGTWNSIGFTEADLNVPRVGTGAALCSDDGLPRIEAVSPAASGIGSHHCAVLLTRAQEPKLSTESVTPSKTVVVAGHDLKFARGIIDELDATRTQVAC